MGRVNRAAAVKTSALPATVADRRSAMPVVAAFIDSCREQFGAAMVDRQLAIAQQARREHDQVLAQQGEHAAAHWLRANAHRCTFWAEEGGRTVGLRSPWGRGGDGMATA